MLSTSFFRRMQICSKKVMNTFNEELILDEYDDESYESYEEISKR